MASKKKARKPRVATPAQRAAIRKSFNEINAAHKRLDLLLKKHVKMVSPMYFAL
jgi:hypothetical protein